MFDFLSFFIVGLLVIFSIQYEYFFFAPIIVIFYSIFFPGYLNLLLVLLLAVMVFIKTADLPQFWLIICGVCSVIVILAAIFRKGKAPQEEGGNYEDLLRMLGGGQ